MNRLAIICTILSLLVGSLPVHAQEVVPTDITLRDTHIPHQLQCGEYRYNVEKLADGLFITMTDEISPRTIFTYEGDGPTSHSSIEHSPLRACLGNAMLYVERLSMPQGRSEVINAIDPTGPYLRIHTIASRSTDYVRGYTNWTYSPENTIDEYQFDSLLKQGSVSWSIVQRRILSKRQLSTTPSDALNDSSYYVKNENGTLQRHVAKSNLNHTTALASIVCENQHSYILYKKELSSYDQSEPYTKSDPPMQLFVERSGNGQRVLLSIPWTPNGWISAHSGDTSSVRINTGFRGCLGTNAILHISSPFVRGNVLIADSQHSFVDYLNEQNLFEYDYSFSYGLVKSGSIYHTDEGNITGDSRITIVHRDGIVQRMRPKWFKDLRSYPHGTSMSFWTDPQDENRTVVRVSQPTNDPAVYTNTTYRETNGVYTEIPNDIHTFEGVSRFTSMRPHPMTLESTPSGIVLQTNWGVTPLLLHGMGRTPYTLLSYRIGPLELNGSHKVWYRFLANGRVENWYAIIK